MDNGNERGDASRSSESIPDHLKPRPESSKSIENENYSERPGGRSLALDGAESGSGNKNGTLETPLASSLTGDLIEEAGEEFSLEQIKAAMQLCIRQTHFSGPLPDPETLARYAEIMPELPERVTRMAEKDLDTRSEIALLESRVEAKAIGRLTLSYSGLPYALLAASIFFWCLRIGSLVFSFFYWGYGDGAAFYNKKR